MTDTAVSWVLGLRVKDGADAAARIIADLMTERARREPGVLSYEWFGSADVWHLRERFADSAATAAHVTAFNAESASDFLAAFDAVSLTVYGSPSAEVVAMLEGWGPTYLASDSGFVR